MEAPADSRVEITPQERRFADEFFSGQHAGNRTRSYLAVHPESSYDTASVEASDLLKQPRIRAYLDQLHDLAAATTAGRLIPFADLLPMAQSVIIATVQGRLRNRLAYEAAKYLVDRVLGSPVASHEVHVRDDARIAQALMAFAKRMSGKTVVGSGVEVGALSLPHAVMRNPFQSNSNAEATSDPR